MGGQQSKEETISAKRFTNGLRSSPNLSTGTLTSAKIIYVPPSNTKYSPYEEMGFPVLEFGRHTTVDKINILMDQKEKDSEYLFPRSTNVRKAWSSFQKCLATVPTTNEIDSPFNTITHAKWLQQPEHLYSNRFIYCQQGSSVWRMMLRREYDDEFIPLWKELIGKNKSVGLLETQDDSSEQTESEYEKNEKQEYENRQIHSFPLFKEI
jgi:hypothetical protein